MEGKKTTSENVVAKTQESVPTQTKKPANNKPRARLEKPLHPPTSEMVTIAMKELKNKKGSSLQAIKKYITITYKVDGEKFGPFIKRYLKSAIASGAVVQTKGKGASGSFKLATGKSLDGSKAKKVVQPIKKPAPKKKEPVEKKASAKKAAPSKKPVVQKKTTPEKKTTPKKIAPAKPKGTNLKAKNVSKAKRSVKAPAAKTKTPKPKKAAAAPKSVKAARK